LAKYVGYFNDWRPHRSLGQRAPCAQLARATHRNAETRKIIAIPVLGGAFITFISKPHDDVSDLIFAPYSWKAPMMTHQLPIE
jgi:hypothetical protein